MTITEKQINELESLIIEGIIVSFMQFEFEISVNDNEE